MSLRAVWRCAVAVSLGCGLVVACTSGSHPSATPSTSPTRAGSGAVVPTGAATDPAGPVPASARAAFGNFRTLDPCSLVDPATLSPLGRVSFGDPQSLDYCVVEVATPAGNVEVHVGELVAAASFQPASVETPAPRLTRQLSGGQEAAAGSPGLAGCADHVTFTDQVAVLATAAPASGPATTTTCTVADAALQGVLDRISGGRVAHRTYPKGSFGPVDGCATLTHSTVIDAVASMGTTGAVVHPAGHQCEYGDPDSTYVALVLAAAYARFDGGPASTTVVMAHHQVVLVPEQPDGRPGECVGYGPHIAFPSRSGQPAIEMAELHVALPTGATDEAACRDVRALAGPVFARLP